MDEAVAKLKRVGDAVISDPALKAVEAVDGKMKILTTYCNVGAEKICNAMGYSGFWNKQNSEYYTANEIYDICARDWKRAEPEWASEFANSGGLAVACQKGAPHGHVTVLAPYPMVYSGKWAKTVPMVYNVGKENRIMGANYAFEIEPAYFVLNQNV